MIPSATEKENLATHPFCPEKKKRRKESEDKITNEMIKETTPYVKDSESFTTSRDCHVTYRSPIRSTILFYICYTC